MAFRALRSRVSQALLALAPVAREISRRVSLAVRALDDPRDRQIRGGNYPRDRYSFDRQTQLRDSLDAWRENPLARRIVELTTEYVVGGGIWLETKNADTRKFLKEWWEHRLNRMETRVFELCDELSRAGELYIVLSTDAGGMSYVRAIPAADVDEIISKPNDIEQVEAVVEKPAAGTLEGRTWKGYDEATDTPVVGGGFQPVILHYAINRPVGAKHGEGDLFPLLKWLSRYASWLEDRTRLNRFRNIFMWILTGKFPNAEARAARQAEVMADPPGSGTVLVVDETEKWETTSPKLESRDASEDGLAIKKMVAAGAATPLHFIGEPESSTRTTAEAAGGPTYRHYQKRQIFFLWMLKDIAKISIKRAAMLGRRVTVKAEVTARGTDISARDNSSLAMAATRIVQSFILLYDRGLIDERELLRLSYNFAGELVDVDELLKSIVPPRTPPATTPTAGAPATAKTEPDQAEDGGLPEDTPEEEA